MYLEPTREHIDNPWDFAEADDLLIRNVSHVDFASKRKKVMFAERVALDVLHDDHAIRIGWEQCAIDDGREVLAVARGQECHGLATACGRALQAVSLWILADFYQELCKEVFHRE